MSIFSVFLEFGRVPSDGFVVALVDHDCSVDQWEQPWEELDMHRVRRSWIETNRVRVWRRGGG